MANYDGGKADSTYSENAEMEGSYAMENNRADRIQLRRDHEDRWEAEDPVLAEGEIGLVIDRTYFKVGDNVNRWSELPRYDFDVQIEDAIGNRQDAVMSQKAVTDAINVEKIRAIGAEQTLQNNITTETTRATNAERTLQTSINSEISNRQTAITNLQNTANSTFATKEELNTETTRATAAEQTLTNNLNKEKTDRTTAITNINNTTNQNVFCTTEEGNEIFKEVYIYPYVSIRNVSKIVIEKGVITESGAKKYQITFIDTNGKYSYIYFGSSSSITQGEVVSGNIQNQNNEGFGYGKTFYAVIDWNEIPDGGSKTITTNFTSLILNSKHSPIITHVMQSYKFVKGSLGNVFIRELYLENLRRIDTKEDGTSQTHYYLFTPAQIKDTFVLSNIKRNVDSTWTINFGAIGTNGNFYPFSYETKENPENSDVIKADILCWIGDGSVQYKATMHAVVDWTQIPNGTSVNYGRPLLGGVVQKRLSPIIYNYIEINKLLEELNSRPINNEE